MLALLLPLPEEVQEVEVRYEVAAPHFGPATRGNMGTSVLVKAHACMQLACNR